MPIVRRAPRKDNFTIIYNDLLNSDLPWDTLGVLVYLLSKPDDWTISSKQLQNLDRGAGDNALRRIFKELEEAGYMIRDSWNESTTGRRAHSVVVFDQPTTLLGADSDVSAGQPTRDLSTCGSSTSGSPTRGSLTRIQRTERPRTDEQRTEATKPVPLQGTSSDKPTPESVDKNGYTESFSSVWKRYPNKKAKKGAFKAWSARLKEGVSIEALTEAADNYIRELKRNRTEAKFVMMGQTFWGPNERYADYLDMEPDPHSQRHNVMDADEDESKTGLVQPEDIFGDGFSFDE